MRTEPEKHSAAPAHTPPARRGAAATRKPQTFSTLQFECEVTGGVVTYEVPSDAGTVKHLWQRRVMLNCSHCGTVHDFAFRPAFIRAALSTPGLELALTRHG